MLDARRLLTFRAVAHHGSFSRAAEALALSQPAVSQQVAALERELGASCWPRPRRRGPDGRRPAAARPRGRGRGAARPRRRPDGRARRRRAPHAAARRLPQRARRRGPRGDPRAARGAARPRGRGGGGLAGRHRRGGAFRPARHRVGFQDAAAPPATTAGCAGRSSRRSRCSPWSARATGWPAASGSRSRSCATTPGWRRRGTGSSSTPAGRRASSRGSCWSSATRSRSARSRRPGWR